MSEMTLTKFEAMDDEALLTPGEVAHLFRVSPKTVRRWGATGRVTSVRTLGGHHRYRAGEVRRAQREMQPEPEDEA